MKTFSITMTVFCACSLGDVRPADSANSDWKVAIELNDGGCIVGTPNFKSIRFQTSTIETEIPLRSLYSARFGSGVWVAHTDQNRRESDWKDPDEIARREDFGWTRNCADTPCRWFGSLSHDHRR